MAITWDEWKTILTGGYGGDLGHGHLQFSKISKDDLFFWEVGYIQSMGQPRSTTSCNVKPTPSLQASERSESRASLHSGNVAWTKIQLVAGYYMSFGGKTQVGYPPATHKKKQFPSTFN